MKQLKTILLILISLVGYSQTELLPVVAWRTYVYNVEMLTDSTYKFDVMPLDWNEPGAAMMDYGNYFQDQAGNKYQVIDSAYLSVTVWDEFERGVSPEVNRIGVMYETPLNGTADYFAPISYLYLDETALDNARAIELAAVWSKFTQFLRTDSINSYEFKVVTNGVTNYNIPFKLENHTMVFYNGSLLSNSLWMINGTSQLVLDVDIKKNDIIKVLK
jgi:hypothetical protein